MNKYKRLVDLPDGRYWLWGNLGLALMGKAMLSKYVIQFSVDGWGCVPSLWFCVRPYYGRGNSSNGDPLQKDLSRTVVFSAPDPMAEHCKPIPTLETPGHSQASLG